MKFSVSRRVLVSLGLITLLQPALFAADWQVSTSTTALQTTSTGQNGTVTGSGSITVSSGNNVPVTMSGTSSLINSGTIQQGGGGRAIDSTASDAILTVTNNSTGTISSVSTDAFRVSGTNSQVTLNNYGSISVSAGGQAIDWATLTGTNILNNYSTGSITAVGEDAVRPGINGQITNAGIISATPTGTTSPSGSDGIDLRTQLTGIVVTNTGTISGRHGIATDGANVGPSSITINTNAGTISALNGSGVNIDGVNTSVTATIINAHGATIKGGVTSASTSGDGDGIDVDGVLTLTNSGDILGLGAKGANKPEGDATGGGSITNTATGRIIGSSSSTDAPNGDNSKIGSGILVDDSNGGNAVAATTITNSGLIQGKSGTAIKLIGTFSNTITNNSGGTLQGAGDATTVGAAIQTGNGNDTVSNAGSIVGENGKAIDLQGGNDSLELKGGSVSGSIDGGSGTNTLKITTGTSSTNGSVTNFSSASVESGRWNHSSSISSGTAISITGGVLNYTGTGALNNSITVNGGEFKNNGGNFTGTLNFIAGTVSGSNLSGVNLVIGANKTLSPGNSPGTMATGNETWAAGGTYLWEINALAANGGSQGTNPGWDFAEITGTLDITATTGNKFSINIDSLNLLTSWDSSQNYTFVIATASDGITGFDSSLFTLTSTAFTDQHDLNGGSFSIRQNGNSVELQYTAVPEPSTWSLIALGLAVIGWTGLRRSRKAEKKVKCGRLTPRSNHNQQPCSLLPA